MADRTSDATKRESDVTRGRSGDRTFTGHNGAREQALRDMDKLARTPAGVAGRLAAPSADAIRGYIAAQMCPWCGAGPYQMLATHTNRAHGIDRHELRELAGLLKGAKVCAPEITRSRSDQRKGVPLPASAYDGRASAKPRRYSSAGLEIQRAKFAGLDRTACAHIGARASAAKTLTANAQNHALIVQLYDEGVPMGEIADRVGVARPTVRRVVQRAGRNEDGRSRRWRSA